MVAAKDKKRLMNAHQYKRARERLGFSNLQFCKKLGVSIRVAQRYESDEQQIPNAIAKLILMFLKHGIPDEF